MKKTMFQWIVYTLLLAILISCNLPDNESNDKNNETNNINNKTVDQNNETFDESNRPTLEFYKDESTSGISNKDYFFVKPWNYEKDYNAGRTYPLLIYLHGSSQTRYLKNLYYMGMGYYPNPASDNMADFIYEYHKDIADEFRKTYPCFTLVPQGPSNWDTTVLIAEIEEFKAKYRIDTNRIYVHGFSMGGAGTYSLANAYYDYNGQLFAGIIRLTGGLASITSRDAIVAKTSIWVQVGLQDTSAVSGIRAAYTYLKNHSYNTGAVETSSAYTIIDILGNSHEANTVTLTKGGIEIAKKTEYTNDNHFITSFPFKDPNTFKWLFNQSLGKR